jgi:hypothetical protein
MVIAKKSIFIAKLNSIKSIVEKSSDKQKLDLIGTILANEFNKLLLEIGEEYPELKNSLPSKITSTGPFSEMNKADINYIDLEIFTESVMSLLNLADNK